METAEHREPYESRGSRTDLGAPGGESPPGDSTFTSVPELERAIYDYIEHNNADPKPFVWTKSANDIIRKVNRGRAALKMPPLSRHA
jgi:hypothetical protein